MGGVSFATKLTSGPPKCDGTATVTASPEHSASKLQSLSITMVSDIPGSTMGAFSRYEESAFDACEGNNVSDHDEASTCSSFWELTMTMYLPLLKRSISGIIMLVRTVIFGHLVRSIFGNVSKSMNEKSPSWLSPMVQPMGPHSKPDTKSWPPPALTALTLLTVFALVVHPDGFTWVVLGKVK